MLIARLIAETRAGETGDLDPALDALARDLSDQGTTLASATMIEGDGAVIQLNLTGDERDPVLAAIDRHFGSVDVLISSGEIVIPHLFVSDMDSTMIGQECIDELADYAGIKDRIAAITERAMLGELDFEAALRERVALLAGLDETAIDQCLDERITPTPGARTLVATLAAHGARCVLVTGGFHHFADPVGDKIGFHRVVGNRLAVENGKLTGELSGPVCDSATKASVLAQESERLGAEAITMAAGDGANDIPMIESATYGIAYRAKPKARAAANGRIDRGDLTALLLLLGIAKKDWVSG